MWHLGAGQLSTAELLAILLGSGGVGHSAIALGYEIVRRGLSVYSPHTALDAAPTP